MNCSRSKQAQFYLLNPISPYTKPINNHQQLLIGIDNIDTPSYTEKPQLIIYDKNNQVEMKEFHQWAEMLDKTIKRVIKTNLVTLLPNSIIEQAPWDIKFQPDYHLQITIAEFKINQCGDSSLRADYLIYYHDKLIRKHHKYYHLKLKLTDLSIANLVASMNTNLNHFTQDIAKTFTHSIEVVARH